MSQDRIFNFVQCWHCGAEIRTPNEDKLEAQVEDLKKALQLIRDWNDDQDNGFDDPGAVANHYLAKYEP